MLFVCALENRVEPVSLRVPQLYLSSHSCIHTHTSRPHYVSFSLCFQVSDQTEASYSNFVQQVNSDCFLKKKRILLLLFSTRGLLDGEGHIKKSCHYDVDPLPCVKLEFKNIQY